MCATRMLCATAPRWKRSRSSTTRLVRSGWWPARIAPATISSPVFRPRSLGGRALERSKPDMPFVVVEFWEGRTVEQKRNLVKAITEAMVTCAGCKPEHLHVVIHDTPKDSWGRAGILGIDMEENK